MSGKNPKSPINLSRAMWQFLLYPDSACECLDTDDLEDVWRYLDELMVPILVSPLHDMDVKDDGSGKLKKPHYHVLVQFDGPVPYKQCLAMFEGLGVKILKVVPSRRTCERYWCHLDSPWKVKYDTADLRCFGGYVCKYLGDQYEQNSLKEIHDIIEDLGIVNFADLGNEIVSNYGELMGTFLRYHAYFNNFCHSRYVMTRNADNGSYVKYASTRRLGSGR